MFNNVLPVRLNKLINLDLLHCPCCGAEPEAYIESITLKPSAVVRCPKCYLEMKRNGITCKIALNKVIDAWNKRIDLGDTIYKNSKLLIQDGKLHTIFYGRHEYVRKDLLTKE